MDTESRHSLAELARVAGVTSRTVRYYIAQGLLPGAHDAGPGAWYDDGHFARLRLIRDLQRQHLPLAEIRGRLAALGDDEIAELVEQRSSPPEPPSGSALDYIRGVIERSALHAPSVPPPATSVPAPSLGPSVLPPSKPAFRPSAPPSFAPSPEPPYQRAQWERITLAPDIELHVRRPLPRTLTKRVDRLIAIARELFEEDQP